jgi:hypothetical protein
MTLPTYVTAINLLGITGYGLRVLLSIFGHDVLVIYFKMTFFCFYIGFDAILCILILRLSWLNASYFLLKDFSNLTYAVGEAMSSSCTSLTTKQLSNFYGSFSSD